MSRSLYNGLGRPGGRLDEGAGNFYLERIGAQERIMIQSILILL
jgi:hypothetical protein